MTKLIVTDCAGVQMKRNGGTFYSVS